MVILIRVQLNPERCFLVRLPETELIEEVEGLIQKRRNSKAIVTALSKGKFLGEVSPDEIHLVEANMILTEKNVHKDLT